MVEIRNENIPRVVNVYREDHMTNTIGIREKY
jgi:hypothetical protein